LSYQLSILKTFADNLSQHFKEPISIVALAAIESKRLFVKVTEQMERLDADIRASNGSL